MRTKIEPFYRNLSYHTYQHARERASERKYWQVKEYMMRAKHSPRNEYLTEIVQHSARNACADDGESIRFFDQCHTQKAHHTACNTIRH